MYQTLTNNKKRMSTGKKKRRRSSLKNREIVKNFVAKQEDRLARKMEKIEYLADVKNEDLQEKCTFTPAICNKSRGLAAKKGLKPIYQRYNYFFSDCYLGIKT